MTHPYDGPILVDYIEPAPGATVWYGEGLLDDGYRVGFVGDWRPMSHLAEAVSWARATGDDLPTISGDGTYIVGLRKEG